MFASSSRVLGRVVRIAAAAAVANGALTGASAALGVASLLAAPQGAACRSEHHRSSARRRASCEALPSPRSFGGLAAVGHHANPS